ncbi:MAG: serine/threonine protein kinase [Planctomycetes bacterium]|nr:serine/threonine protein kinase [Planctomycetota bacterium]
MNDRSLDDSALLAKIAEALERNANGLAVDPLELAEGRDDWADRIREALGLAEVLPDLQRASTFGKEPRVLADRYHVVRPIGSGAMGVVYLARDAALKRDVAIKVLRSEFLDGDEPLARFAREAEVLAATKHPNVVTLFDRGRTDDGLHYLVMEHLEGASLAEILERASELAIERGGPEFVDDTRWLTVEFGIDVRSEANWVRCVTTWMLQLAEGLQVAHEASILHRDVKPSNVFVRKDGTIALLDFGIAARPTKETLATRSAALGTPAYMAPEQLEARRDLTPRVDVYGLTATLYTALTFRPPYAGTLSQVLQKLQRDDPPLAQRLRPGLPRDMEAILEHGMTRRVEGRYESARALGDDLRAFLDYRPVSVRPARWIERALRKAARSPGVRAGIAVAVVMLVAWWSWSWHVTQREVVRQRERHLAQQRARDYEQLRGSLLAGLSLSWDSAARRITDAEERERIRRDLDRLVELADAPLPALLQRALFRVDHDDSEGARADIERLERELDMPNAARLAGMPWDTGEIVPVETRPFERFVAAHGVLRERTAPRDRVRIDQALGYLDHPELEDDLPARELVLLLEVDRSVMVESRSEKVLLYRRLAEECQEIAAQRPFGHSNVTRHVLGTAWSMMGRDREAADLLSEGCRVDPWSAPSHFVLGFTLSKLASAGWPDLFPRAEQALRRAIEIRPSWVRAHEMLVSSLADRKRYDEALAWVDRIPYEDTALGNARRVHRRAVIHLSHALRVASEDSWERARSIAEMARVDFVAAANAGHGPDRREYGVLLGLLERDEAGVARVLLQDLTRDPTDWARLDDLLRILPEVHDAELARDIHAYLDCLRQTFAPDMDRGPSNDSIEHPPEANREDH